MNKGRWIAVGAFCGLMLLGPMTVFAGTNSPVVRVQEATTLTRKVKVGDSVRYKTTLELTAQGTDVTVEQNRKRTVKEVKETGEIVTEVAGEGDKLIVGGESQDAPANAPTLVTTDKNGKILSYKPTGSDDPYLPASTLHLLELADEIELVLAPRQNTPEKDEQSDQREGGLPNVSLGPCLWLKAVGRLVSGQESSEPIVTLAADQNFGNLILGIFSISC